MPPNPSVSMPFPDTQAEVFDAHTAKFQRLISERIITRQEFQNIVNRSNADGTPIENLLITGHVPKYEVLRCISEHHGLPFLEYDEGLLLPPEVAHRVNLEKLKVSLWFPLGIVDGVARVVVADPAVPGLLEEIKETLKVTALLPFVALPSDVIRLIENQQDVNPNFPPSSGRTPLARLRTALADGRTEMSHYRTSLAVGRTGLALMRTGISFMSIAMILLKIFGFGYLSILAAMLMVIGLVMSVDGLKWYLPTRDACRDRVVFEGSQPTFGTTVLQPHFGRDSLDVVRSAPIAGAEELRSRWNRLTPVMRRRFLAIDRTDLSEERTVLAAYRSSMARARTGLAFTRTGIASVGLGIAMLRQFPGGSWMIFYGVLIFIGVAMGLEGVRWYLPGREAGKQSLDAVQQTQKRQSIWKFMFPPPQKELRPEMVAPLSIKGSNAPGIWGTTGLALDRTLIADRRNVKARLRTVMARSRTGMAFIRTGARIFSVGLGLAVYFGTANLLWTIFNAALMVIGLILIVDGLFWHLPAEKIRNNFPYCFGEMEIAFPDYAKPTSTWKKVVFSHEDF